MKKRIICTFAGILFAVIVGFIFYMSSQTAVNSGNMSKVVTKELIIVSEKLGALPEQTTQAYLKNRNSASYQNMLVEKYEGKVRTLAHMGMYFLLGLSVLLFLCIVRVKGFLRIVLAVSVAFAVSILDEINQMHFAGRNKNGLIIEAITDIRNDMFGVVSSILLFLIIIAFTRIVSKTRRTT